jgi:hypothetical protein
MRARECCHDLSPPPVGGASGATFVDGTPDVNVKDVIMPPAAGAMVQLESSRPCGPTMVEHDAIRGAGSKSTPLGK